MSRLLALVPLPYRIAAIVLLFLASVGAGFVKGINYENDRHTAKEVALQKAVDEQKVKVAQVTADQENITQGIVKKYENRIASINNYYSGLLNNTNGSALSQVPNSSSGVDATTADTLLVEQCTQSTAQLEALQEWILQEGAATNSLK